MFNTSIQERGFYLILEDSGSTFGAADIFGTFRYVWNTCIDYLKSIQVIDRYGRLMQSIQETVDIILRDTNKDSIPEALLYKLRRDDMLAEWTKTYPYSLLMLPVYQLAEKLNCNKCYYCKLTYLKLGDWDMDVVIPINSLHEDLKDIYINQVVREKFLNLEIRMKNQLGNNVRLVLESNTSRMDEFLNQLSQSEQYIIHSVIWIARSKTGHRKGKLMCSIIIDNALS